MSFVFGNFGDGNWRQAEAWIVLLAGAVEVNAILPKERYGNSFRGCGSNNQPSYWESDILPLSYLFSAFGQPGCIARFCNIWRNVTSLQLTYVASPDWTSRKHPHVDTSGPKTFDNDGRHPSRVAITSWSKINGITWIADLVRNGYLSYGKLSLKLLRLVNFFCLLALSSVGRQR